MAEKTDEKANPKLSRLLAWLNENVRTTATPPVIALKPDWRYLDTPRTPAERERHSLWDAITAYEADFFPLQLPWLLGAHMEFRHASQTAQQLFVHGDFDPNEFALLDRILQEGMTFVDVGANVGLYTIFAAKKVGRDGAVFSFEPSRREAGTLTRNIALNGLLNVSAYQMAVGEEVGECELSVAPGEFDGMNSIFGLSIFQEFPNIRYTTDRNTYAWASFYGAETNLTIDPSDQLEIAIYSDSKFVFDLRRLQIKAAGGSLEPWRLDIESEQRVEFDSSMNEVGLHADIKKFGDITIERTPLGLNLKGEPGSGVIFRWRLSPASSMSVKISGRPAGVAPVAKEKVAVTTLDRLLAERPQSRFDVIKIDAEGGERAVLAGAREMIKRDQPLILTEILTSGAGDAGNAEAVGRQLQEAGYTFFDVAKGPPRVIDLGDNRSTNVIAAPNRFLAEINRMAGGAQSAASPRARKSAS